MVQTAEEPVALTGAVPAWQSASANHPHSARCAIHHPPPSRYHAALMESDELLLAFRRHWDEIHDADRFLRLGGGELKDVFLEDS